jgi:hypothetical protein
MGALRIKIMVIFISGVNIRNEYRVNIDRWDRLRAVEFIDETTRKIYLLSDQERKSRRERR